MNIEIIGTESLGVRGMCCFVKTKTRSILFDPGIALGYTRYGLLPHPYQIATGERIKEKIIKKWMEATDVVISHFHGDHVALLDANPYQLDLKRLAGLNPKTKLWSKNYSNLSQLERKRSDAFISILNNNFIEAEKRDSGVLSFSENVPHGNKDSYIKVMMTRIKEDFVFVHGSDIQLLNDISVSKILDWGPDILFVDGPPIYLNKKISKEQVKKALKNALELSRKISTIIIDHHLMRNFEGEKWLDSLSLKAKNKVICGADFMNKPRMLFEASRSSLYRKMPVAGNWHEMYAAGKTNTDYYRDLAGRIN